MLKVQRKKRENNKWVQYVQLYRELNPGLNHKQALQDARESYHKLNSVYQQNGGFKELELNDPETLFLKDKQIISN